MSAVASDDNSWQAIEFRAYDQMAKRRKAEDDSMKATYDRDVGPIQKELVGLFSERTKLETRLKDLKQTIARHEGALDQIDKEYAEDLEKVEKRRLEEDKTQQEFFERFRLGKVGSVVTHPPLNVDPDSGLNGSRENGAPVDGAAFASAAPSSNANGLDDHPTNGDAMDVDPVEVPHRPRPKPAPLSRMSESAAEASTAADDDFKPVPVVDSDQNELGEVKSLSFRNQWTDKCRSLPVRRHVEIRGSRKFTSEHLQSIYEPSDSKGAKWIGCMIQATGEVQETVCEACTRGNGVFASCIMFPGSDPDFPRCGNCEWARQGCHGASLLPLGANDAPGVDTSSAPAPTGQEPVLAAPVLGTGGFTPVNASAANTPRSLSASGTSHDAKPSRKSLPSGGKAPARKSMSGAAPRSPTHKGTPGKSPIESEAGTPRDEEQQQQEGDDPDLPEITRATLSLKHDGVVYFEPELMEGVPLRKINELDPYWDPTWKPIGEFVQSQLGKWQSRHAELINNQIPTEKHAKFLAGRQVNRGILVAKYLEVGEINPYQLVNKRFINSGFLNYDTLHRMVGTLDELRKFTTLDCTPLEWLRERLNEIYVENPEGFILSKVVHTLYHDPKLQNLRSKNGFGNIGRPSGYKAKTRGFVSQDIGSFGASAAKKARAEKRKDPHSTPKGTPSKIPASVPTTGSAAPSPSAGFGANGEHENAEARDTAAHDDADEDATLKDESDVKDRGMSPERKPYSASQQLLDEAESKGGGGLSPSTKKKPRLTPDPTSNPQTTDFDFDGYTSTDSYSHDTVLTNDWRVSQVKTATQTSNTDITQYWHFVDASASDGNYFEHQVLREVDPPAWGVYKEPIDFHLRLEELKEIIFSGSSLRIIVSTRRIDDVDFRGDVLAQFKRERTKRRFLKFVKKKGVKLLKTNAEYINNVWDSMDSELLPIDDSDE